MLVIPLQALPNQSVTALLGQQNCIIDVYQKYTGLYCDLYSNDVLVRGGIICLNSNRIVREEYLNFGGDLIFYDLQGQTDPVYTGLGGRYQLLYLEPSDLTTLGLAA